MSQDVSNGAGGAAPDALLRITGLRVRTGERELLHGLDLEILRGQRVGLIGESGSGKSLTCLSVMGLLPQTLRSHGSVVLEGEGELLGRSESSLATLRGSRMSMVFQEPMTALNPLMRVGDQVAEILTLHRPDSQGSRRQDERTAVELLAGVRLPDPARAAAAYPHELSGGQRQRVMLAMAMANRPDLLLADEPTTALDVTVQNQVLDLMRDQVDSAGSSLLFITHDLGIVASICERVVILRDGVVVEAGEIDQVFSDPRHPYTKGLLAASALATHPRTGRLVTVRDFADADEQEPVRVEPVRVEPVRVEPENPAPVVAPHDVLTDLETSIVFNRPASGPHPLIAVTELTRVYHRSNGPFGRKTEVPALRGVSFDVRPGERFGIVGESGCGKSTLLRLITALDEPTSGSIRVSGVEIAGTAETRLRWLRETMQIVFQDPMGSLDPRMRVLDIVAEPLRGVSREERSARVAELLEAVGLPRAAVDRFPHQFSGGQRQRIAIARALVTRPQVLVADEAVSALDVSVRAQVLNLLSDLVQEYRLTMVFVSHDLNVVRHACDTVAVMHAGRIVECGPSEAVLEQPRHPYTAELVAAVPRVRVA